MQFCQLSDQQIEKAQTVSHSLWSDGLSLSDRIDILQDRLHHHSSLIKYFGLLDDNTQLLSSVKLYQTKINLHSQHELFIGLGAVYTEEKLRGQGFATKLIKSTIDYAKKLGFSGLFLWSDIGRPFYESFGFKAYAVKRLSFKLQVEPTQYKYRKAVDSDLDFMFSLFRERTKHKHLSISRDKESWKFYRQINITEDYILLDEHNQSVGYFSGLIRNDHFFLDEAFCLTTDFRKGLEAVVAKHGEYLSKSEAFYWQGSIDFDPKHNFEEIIKKPIPMLLCFDKGQCFEEQKEPPFFGRLDCF